MIKRRIYSYILLACATLFSTTFTNNLFEKLNLDIFQGATEWSSIITKDFDTELSLTYLNLFALNDEGDIKTLIKCIEYLEEIGQENPELLSLHNALGTNIIDILNMYIYEMQKKIEQKKNISEKEKDHFLQQLELKTRELVAYINNIYYKTLYLQITKRNKTSLFYMFDENGLIPQEKRNKILPQPQ